MSPWRAGRWKDCCEHAIAVGSFLRVDMEGSAYTQRTLDLVRELHRRPGAAGHIGTVLQAYLYRTEEDARLLCAEGIRIRLCKGAYREPAAIAYPDKRDVDANYLRVAKQILGSGLFHGLATHDEKIISAMQGVDVRRKASQRRRSNSKCCTGCAATCS